MLKNQDQLGELPKLLSNANTKDIGYFAGIPLVQVRAQAGFITGFGDDEYISSLPTIPVMVDKHYRGKYRCFECSGDSMDDGTKQSICDRDIVLGRSLEKVHWQNKLHINNNRYWIIIHTEGINIKQIIKHEVDKGLITCHSLNPLYEDFILHLDDVKELYNVIRIVDRAVRI